MDPVTAALNAYTATLDFMKAVVEKMTPDQFTAIIQAHEARVDFLFGLVQKLNPGAAKQG